MLWTLHPTPVKDPRRCGGEAWRLHSFGPPWCAGFPCSGPHATILQVTGDSLLNGCDLTECVPACVLFAYLTFHCKNNRPTSLQPAAPVQGCSPWGGGAPLPWKEQVGLGQGRDRWAGGDSVKTREER